MRRCSILLVALLTVLTARTAFAQFGPGGGGMRPPGQQPMPGAPGAPPEKEEGPAEAAPEQQAESPALQPLPAWPQQREKQLQFFQLNGYIRFRAYLFHSLNLGIVPAAMGPSAPFSIPYTEFGQNGMYTGSSNAASCAARMKSNCIVDNMTSADMRMRLEPTVNVTEQVRVKAQLDVFDNMVLGSTPQGFYINNAGSGIPGAGAAAAPIYGTNLAFNSHSAQAPIQGVNSAIPSILAKRAWAEVRTPFGELRFGRMPSHWGMGMMTNNGDCLDCDYGTNVDRVMFATKLWGHFIALMWDWIATGPTTNIIGPQTGQGVQYNADILDDVSQWSLAIGKQDKPEELKEKLDAGKIVFNYGLWAIYRQQGWDQTGPLAPSGNSYPQLQANIHPRLAQEGTVDVWLRLNWKKLHLEAEGTVQFGQIGNLSDVYGPSYKGSTDILAGGFVVKADYKLLRDSLKIYLEVGYASGDDNEDLNGVTNYQRANIVPQTPSNHIGRFYFDPDYHVDLILFRRILGTVYNATYFKPGISYDIIDNFGARLDLMYAMANRPVGFPGNSVNLGLEIDAQLMYKNEEEGFYAGLVYGVLFPFGALSLPAEIYGTQYAKTSPDIAQTFQARLIVKF